MRFSLILILIALTLSALVGIAFAKSAKKSPDYEQLQLFADVFETVRLGYVEKPDEQKLVENAINGMLTALDPHSNYLDEKTFEGMRKETQGKFGGVGISITQEEGFVKVMTPIDDTPASRAGILANDLIVEINDESTSGMTLAAAAEKMRGSIGTPVKLTILRGEYKQKLEIKLVRAEIHINSVRSSKQGGDIGYVRISQFNEETTDGLRAAMLKFQKEIPADKFKGYILDLRNNPGGLLNQSIQVVNAFMDKGEIVSTRGRTAEETDRYVAIWGGDLSKGKPVVVLINGGSASAAEVVAGALQDHKRATVLGTRSFGKGSVQTIIPLGGNKGALKLTTARFFTPSGRSIQAKGIDPDIVVLQDVPDELKGKDDTKGEASLKGHLKNGDDEKTSSQSYVPTDEKKDKPFLAAIELLRWGNTPSPK